MSNVVAISSGEYHCLALKADGTVVVWGRDNQGQTNVPANLTNVTAIACGGYFSLALKTDGTVASWGNIPFGQANELAVLTNIVALAGGFYHAMAIGNLAPQAISQAANGYVNHDLTVQLNAIPGDGPSLNYRVAALPSVGTLYQFTNGSRGQVLSLASPQVTDANGRVIFASVTNATGSPYNTFNFVAYDGLNDSAPATVTLNIGLPAAPQWQQTSWTGGTSETFTLGFLGSSNATYSLWASTNLTVWNWLGTAPEISPGLYQFTDTTTSNWPARFYRVSAP